MKKLLIAFLLSGCCVVYADPGIMIDIDIILDKPSGPGGVVMGAICK